MPEGPEIRIAADEVGAAITNRTADEVYFAFDHLKTFERKLSGQQVSAVEARGKAMLVRFANDLNIYSHNQLYGKWIVRQARTLPRTKRQLRVAIHNRLKSALLYSASDIEVLSTPALNSHPYLSKLGPDVLDDSVTPDRIVDQFTASRFWRRRLTSLLLDQQFLAGLGNYLRSEILFVARVHPSLRPVDCSPQQIRQLAEASLELARQSYRTKGLTNDLDTAERLRQAGVERSQYRFRTFNRAGEPCYVCGTIIEKSVLGGRRIYYCPTCQDVAGTGSEEG